MLNLFDQISTGSSMNPDIQSEEHNIDHSEMNEDTLNYQKNLQISEYEEEEEEEEDIVMDQEVSDKFQIDDSFQPYDYSNTIDKVFKTEKRKRNLSDFDPRRFEDA